jgi:hypothetical protein
VVALIGRRYVSVMTPAAFKQSFKDKNPPVAASSALAALWWAANGDWNKAHGIVMKDHGADSAWVHAYLHRVEGDDDNAGYWYRQARRDAATGDLAAEWAMIVAALLGSKSRSDR